MRVSLNVGRWLGRSRLIGSFMAVAFCTTTAGADVVNLYVATDGQAGWSGAIAQPNPEGTDGPLPSLQAARDAIRAARARGEWTDVPITVHVRGGTYVLDDALTFEPADSGTAGAPITYAAYADERPILSGGRLISGWHTTEVNGRTAWVTEVPEVKAGQWYFRQLFVDGQRRPRTRLPKEGFYQFAGLPGVTAETRWGDGQTRAVFQDDHIRSWRNLKDVEVVALHFWIESRLPIAEVDESRKIVTFTRESTFRLTDAHNLKEFARYYVENVFEALDEPGQWYLDQSSGTLTYLPLPGQTPESVTVVAPRLDQLVRVTGEADGGSKVRDIEFRGLTFQHADWCLPEDSAGSVQAAVNVPGAVYFEHAEDCILADGEVSHVSGYAVEFGAGCRGNRVDNCMLTSLGGGGVKIGHGSRNTTVHNCRIGPGGYFYHSAVGVWIGSSGHNTVTHNHIHHFYYTGVSVGWTWGYRENPAVDNVIEYNHIHHIGQGYLSDMGGIYTLGVSPGTRIRYNLIHDIEAHTYGGWGLYTDEGSSYILLENNIVYRCKHSGFHQHYGSYNVVKNNIFALGQVAQMMRTREEPHTSFVFERNIVYCDIPTVLGSNWKNGNYRLDYNVYWRENGGPLDFAGHSFEAWQALGNDSHSIVADPLFKDPDNGDFTLDPGSPALKLGFQPIDTSRIGPVEAP